MGKDMKKPTKYKRHSGQAHQWDKQPLGRMKCGLCGKVKRHDNRKLISQRRQQRRMLKRKLAQQPRSVKREAISRTPRKAMTA